MAKDDSSGGSGGQPGPNPDAHPAPLTKPQGAKPSGAAKTPEIGGPKGPEPTRYGDWERDGRCVDF